MIDAAYFENLTAQINAIDECAELQDLANTAAASLTKQLASIEAQIAKLQPYLALLTLPTNPTEVITWITNFVSAFIGPQVAAEVLFVADLAALTASIAQVITALENAEARITHCTITIPPII